MRRMDFLIQRFSKGIHKMETTIQITGGKMSKIKTRQVDLEYSVKFSSFK